MVSLDITETSKALAVTGGYITIGGLVSYFVKEKLFMSESLLAVITAIIFGPLCANIFNPLDWVGGNEDSLNTLTFQVMRIVIAIQVLFTGISLPNAYLWKEWMSLATLLGPVMLCAWFVTSLLIWGLIPGMTYLECLVIGACVTPTDPVLANSICKGRFAEKHVPLHVRNIIVAESGANDGLGFPFLFMALYLILYKESNNSVHSVKGAVGEWFYNIVFYQICLSIILGAAIGYVARKVLRFAEKRNLIDHESFLSFGVALTFFTLGCVGILGSDDILCCFIVGNSFTWDDWFRVQTQDHAFQDVIDQLLSSGVFLFIGAVLPWNHFGEWYGITSPWRLVVLGILVMLVRRLPWVMVLKRFIPTLPTWREAAFAGFFGPIGVGAIFYTQIALQYIPDSRSELKATVLPVVYFLVLTSVVVHGITIPIGKGFQRARTLTITQSISGFTTPSQSRPPTIIGLPVRNFFNHLHNDTPARTEIGGEGRSGIRFDLNRAPPDSPRTPRNGRTGGILSREHSPDRKDGLRGRRSTPQTPATEAPPAPTPTTSGEEPHPDNRERPGSQTWEEGSHVVSEDAEGHVLRVMSKAEYDQIKAGQNQNPKPP